MNSTRKTVYAISATAIAWFFLFPQSYVALAGAMLLAGGAAYFAGLDDLYAVVTTLLGAGIGIAVARVRLRRGGCLQRMMPRVAGRLSTAASRSSSVSGR